MLKTMNVMDAGLLMMESAETPMHIGGVQVLRPPRGAGPDYVRKLRDEVMGFPAGSAPFNYRLARSGKPPTIPAWEVLDHVDLNQHVFRHALPWPGGERELFDLVARLDSVPLDRSRPLWEHHLIEGLAGGRFATFTRIHHALIDGKWGIRLAQATTSPDPRVRGLPPYWAVRFDAEAEPAPKEAAARPEQSWWQRQSAGLQEGVETVAELRKAFGRLVESYRHPTDDGLMPLYTAPECILNGKLTRHRALAVVRLDLARIKRLAKEHGATVNEIVLTLCGGALRRYLLEQDALPDKPLVASMMIAMARPEGGVGGNAIVPAMVSLATHVEDPRQRFETVRGSSQHAKELVRDLPSPVALTVFMGVSGLPFILASIMGRVEKSHAHNLVISNVPGLREKRYVNGALIEAEYPLSVLVPGEAMNITVISRAGMLDVAVLVCPTLAPDPQRVGDAIIESLDELERAFRKPRPRKVGPGAAGRTAKDARTKTVTRRRKRPAKKPR